MQVVKRDGSLEDVSFDKILRRIQAQCEGLNMKFVEPVEVAKKVVESLYDKVTTVELDKHAAETAATMTVYHPDYALLAGRIAMTSLHKETVDCFFETAEKLYNNVDSASNQHAPLISDELMNLAILHRETINAQINFSQDFTYDFFAVRTLEKSYLLNVHGKTVERPQHLLMRVALGIHGGDLENAFRTYRHLSAKDFTHATPTLFNAGTQWPQLSSCFLLGVQDDSIDGIFNTYHRTAAISKWAGGIGLWWHNVRAKGSPISTTNGESNGIIPWLKILNETARSVNQGGKRKGAFAVYLEPWHADIMDFLRIREVQRKEELRCIDLFPAVYSCDLFMEKALNDEDWYLFCPKRAPKLFEVWGDEFNQLYQQYVDQGLYTEVVKARDIINLIAKMEIETGYPYVVYKDAINRKSNQQNIGTIRSSNLCCEIAEFSGYNPVTRKEEIAVCNLASISLPNCLVNGIFDFQKLGELTEILVDNLNIVIDINYYPLPEMAESNFRNRPIGLGIQGLADLFALLKLSFDSAEAKKLNRDIAETIYYHAVKRSIDLAERDGMYTTFIGSPAFHGKLQFDLWEVDPGDRYDWKALKERMAVHGLRNSLLVAPMPTACVISSTKIRTTSGVKSYQEIMSEMGIDWESIEKTTDQQVIPFPEPLMLETRIGVESSPHIVYNGHQPTLKIEMEDGSIFECTHNHKFFVIRENERGWVEASQLRVTDEILTID